MTSPNNPSGYVMKEEEIQLLLLLCKQYNTWMVADKTYYEFLYDDNKNNNNNNSDNSNKHVFPCGHRYNYNKIIHIFSFSKSFGMPGCSYCCCCFY